MKRVIFAFLILLVAKTAAQAQDARQVLTDANAAQVRSKLQAFQNGHLTVEEITAKTNKEWGRSLLLYYLTHTNEITPKMKLPISRWYAFTGYYTDAARLAGDYVQVYSNDWYGWRVIGGADSEFGKYDASMNAYVKAVGLGDNTSCAPLAFIAMKLDRWDVVKNILPRLFIVKNSTPAEGIVPLDAVTALVAYSLETDQKDIFLKALEGVDAKSILSRSDLTSVVAEGCKRFKGDDIDKIKQELEAAKASRSNSVTTTNAPSP